MAYTPSLQVTSELDAVNQMLISGGEAPVSDLVIQRPDVMAALVLLAKASREVQSEGWSFNTEIGYQVQPAGTITYSEYLGGPVEYLNVFPVPPNLLSCTATPHESQQGSYYLDLVQRPSRLWGPGSLVFYDRDRNCDGFARDYLYINPVWMFDFNRLPQEARSLIADMATQWYLQQRIGDRQGAADMAPMISQHTRSLKRNFGDVDYFNIFNNGALTKFMGGRVQVLGSLNDRRINRTAIGLSSSGQPINPGTPVIVGNGLYPSESTFPGDDTFPDEGLGSGTGAGNGGGGTIIGLPGDIFTPPTNNNGNGGNGTGTGGGTTPVNTRPVASLLMTPTLKELTTAAGSSVVSSLSITPTDITLDDVVRIGVYSVGISPSAVTMETPGIASVVVQLFSTGLGYFSGSGYVVATAYNAQMAPVNTPFNWTTSNPNIATVSALGYLTFKLPGTVTITAIAVGLGISGSATFTLLQEVTGPQTVDSVNMYPSAVILELDLVTVTSLTITPTTVNLTESDVESVLVSMSTTNLAIGQSVQLLAQPRNVDFTLLTGRLITYTSNARSVATVDANGLVTGTYNPFNNGDGSGPGPSVKYATITATCEGVSGDIEVAVGGEANTLVAGVEFLDIPDEMETGFATVIHARAFNAQGTTIPGKYIEFAMNGGLGSLSQIDDVSCYLQAYYAGNAEIIIGCQGHSASRFVNFTNYNTV